MKEESRMRIVIIIAFVATVCSLPHSKSKRNTGRIYDIVDIAVSNPVSRSKRSVDDDLPQNLNVQFTAKGKETKIRLRKSAGIKIPVYKMVNAAAVEQHVPRSRRSAVFHDEETGTPVQVTVSGDGDSVNGKKYELEGALSLNSINFGVSVSGGKHILRDIDNISYGHDEKFAPGRSNLTLAEKKAAISKGNRAKRETDLYTVEMLIVCDESVIERFRREYAEEDVDSAIVSYFELQLYTTQLRMDTITEIYPSVDVKIGVTGLLILESGSEAPFKVDNFRQGYVQFDPAIDDFAEWIVANEGSLPKNDHAMWITDEVLADRRDTDTIGVAFVGGACTEYRVSLVEDFYTALTALIMAHELAHNLDALHDSEQGCSDYDAYLMSAYSDFPTEPNRRSNPFEFSDCSATAMVHFLQTSTYSKCLQVDNSGDTKAISLLTGAQPITADVQCKMAMDNEASFFCRFEQSQDTFDNICINLLCYNLDSEKCEAYQPAFDYTSCGDSKWCIRGECVYDSSAPQRKENCPQAQMDGIICAADKCDSYSETHRADCCDVCDYTPKPPVNFCDTFPRPGKCYWCRAKEKRLRKRKRCRKYRD